MKDFFPFPAFQYISANSHPVALSELIKRVTDDFWGFFDDENERRKKSTCFICPRRNYEFFLPFN